MELLSYKDYKWLVIVQRVDTGERFDISRIVHEMTYSTEWMTGAPGTLELLVVMAPWDDSLAFLTKAHIGAHDKHGHLVQFSIDGEGVFYGYITDVQLDKAPLMTVTARDQIFYLKSKDILYTENMTASDIFTDVCNRKAHLVHRVQSAAGAILEPHDYKADSTMFNMIKYAIDWANVLEGTQYMIRDEFGVLVFTELGRLHTGIRLGDGEYAIDYQYQSSIEGETYNHIKFYRANEEIGMYDTWVAQDSGTMARWGELGLIVEADKNLTDAEIMGEAQRFLGFYNAPLETLSVSALGRLGVYAGNGISLDIGRIELAGNFWVTNAKHTFKDCYHAMDLELYYWAGG